MSHEINLVPSIKTDMIRTLKMRNLIFFICIVVGIACAAALVSFGSVVGGQEIAKNSKEKTLNLMSSKIEDNKDDLKDYLTIRDQLGNLSAIANDKKVLSRTFNILSALMPQQNNADKITISELNVSLGTSPTFAFDAQANAGREPFIDYNVLDSFKKSMDFMYYDYGKYIDKDGAELPAYCIIENGEDGSTLNEDGDIYALWTIEAPGCNPSNAEYVKSKPLTPEEPSENPENDNNGDNPDSDNDNDNDNDNGNGNGNSNGDNDNGGDSDNGNNNGSDNDNSETPSRHNNNNSSSNNEDDTEKEPSPNAYKTELYGEDTSVVRIWRTPQFEEWYRDGHITTDGQISGVPHFSSECITYSGQPGEKANDVKWTNTKSCKLVPSTETEPGIQISDSSNGRDSSDELVLRFSAVITLAPEVYAFSNTHMLAIPPTGRTNVTDSYVQIQDMFGEAARDCDPTDTACLGNTQNVNGGNE